ncbi:MAG: glycoside hydrolase family 20 zincin-like fold domain-containing protein [Coprobacillaceae bacterium]
MKIMKKFISVLFCVCMIVPIIQTPILADEPNTSFPESYTIYPTPHDIAYGTAGVSLSDVNIVTTDNMVTPSKTNLEEILTKNNIAYTYSDTKSNSKPNIILGIVDDNPTIQEYFNDLALTTDQTFALDKLEGYVLSVKDNTIFIMGSESIALYYIMGF